MTSLPVEIVSLDPPAARGAAEDLAEILVDAVDGGASVGFVFPFAPAEARAYWEQVIEALAAGRVVLLGARVAGDRRLCGTVQLVPSERPNGRHRAEVAKLLVHRRVRRQGVGRALMAAVEREARARGRRLLILDTLSESPAEALYRSLGYSAAGVIPDHARLPEGPLRPTTVMWRQLPPSGEISVSAESPRQPEVVALVRELDAYLTSLYPVESNHLLDIEALCRPDIRFFVARGQGEALGCGALRSFPEYGEVKRMFVRPQARGFRLGHRILAHLEAEARAQGLPALRLETGVRQPEAIGLYRAAGFVERGPFGEYPLDALSLFLEKPLTAG
jgi:putative acetyltransferase